MHLQALRLAAAVFVLAGCDPAGPIDTGEDDSLERGAVREGHGFAYVGFVPVTERGIDGMVTILPRAVTVHDDTVGVALELTRLFQQGQLTSARAGFFRNGFVEDPSVDVAEPSVPFEDWRTRYWFAGAQPVGLMMVTFSAAYGPTAWVATRPSGSAQRRIEIEPDGAFPVDPQPVEGGVAYAYGVGGTIGIAEPAGSALTPDRVELSGTEEVGSISLAALGSERLVALTHAADEGVALALYRRDDAALEPVATANVDLGDVLAPPLQLLHSAVETYVIATGEDGPRTFRRDGETLTPVPLPEGERHTFAVDDEGALYVGFSDPASGGRASVVKWDGAALVAVGEPGFSRDPVTALVHPHGPDLYVAFTSTTQAVGVAVACIGPSCVPYRPRTEASDTSGVISCSYGGDSCREARGTTAAGVTEFEVWCSGQEAYTYREAVCPLEGAVGACRKTYDGVEELSWSYDTFGKTASIVESTCGALGLEFVPAPTTTSEPTP